MQGMAACKQPQGREEEKEEEEDEEGGEGVPHWKQMRFFLWK